MCGAAYDSSGKLIAEGLRRVPRIAPVQNVVRNQITVDPESPFISGRWAYCGNWNHHFGHFITEALTRTYVAGGDLNGIVYHPNRRGPSNFAIKTWQKTLLERAGVRVPVLIIDKQVRFEELVVSEPQVVIEESVTETAANVWARVSSDRNGQRRVFLSRSALTTKRPREAVNDNQLDAEMEKLGFDVIHPEKLTINEQLDVVAESGIIAGVSGSALHLSAFSNSGLSVIELGDGRSRHRGLPTQSLIDEGSGNSHYFVPLIESDEAGARDINSTCASVRDIVSTIERDW